MSNATMCLVVSSLYMVWGLVLGNLLSLRWRRRAWSVLARLHSICASTTLGHREDQEIVEALGEEAGELL